MDRHHTQYDIWAIFVQLNLDGPQYENLLRNDTLPAVQTVTDV